MPITPASHVENTAPTNKTLTCQEFLTSTTILTPSHLVRKLRLLLRLPQFSKKSF